MAENTRRNLRKRNLKLIRQKRHTEACLCRVGDLLLVGLVVLDLRVSTFLSRWQIFALALANSTIEIPVLDMATMMPVLMGMLGLGAMRTVEKTKKVQRDR